MSQPVLSYPSHRIIENAKSMYVKIAKTGDIPDPGKQYFEVNDRLVVLFHVGGEYYCLEDVCTHDGGPLGEGNLDELSIACPRHGAKFDIRDGKAFGVQFPCHMMEPLTDHAPIFDQHTTYSWIGLSGRRPSRSQFQHALHGLAVLLGKLGTH